jgi:2-(1,2-epoxy-1,2-dihydrophenyl)acetyl-CoA isomerase
MSSPDPVLVEHRDGVAVVTLSRPGRRNGVTGQMSTQLFERLREIAASDARVVVLRGAGDDFSVGADLTDDRPADSSAPQTYADLAPIYHSATLLHTMPQVTIAAIDGGCAGAALGWACACDFRFAADRARFATGFLKVGASGDMGLIWSLPRVIGPARARELLFFGDKITAETALAFDLVTRVFPSAQLHPATLERAAELAGRNPFSLRMMKANVVSAESLSLADYIEIESARMMHVNSSGAMQEGMAAFRAGRG